ncbi:general secretion pathway protein K [Pusillimonas sp. T7-7]|uniref:type II secretion system minor pseudopilin GspK n=1 Tax=Pusillimonas sp. (strain T7-7) TaxID=1007105 RepID=UPI0002085530|nr:type II secretion system minor pseudopilin GspK [Pusillimonas sp. T7-7]AEC19680.1 general secretion pathway protein K [Pusillimonas sp. T7-7]
MNKHRYPMHRRTVAGLHGRQGGMAIIGALVVVAAASIATAAIIERQALLADTLAGERDRVQAKWLLRGGLDWSRVILFNDARRNSVTRKGAIWSQPIVGLEVSTPGQARKAYFSGQIEDEQGKFNIADLAENGMLRPQELAVLETLLAGLNLPISLAEAIARRVAEAQTGHDGAQAAPSLRTLGDLLHIDDMTPEIITILSAYVTILPEQTTINANTASAEVLSASVPGLQLAEARDLVDQRDRGQWFNSRADFFNRLGKPTIKPGNQIGVNSEWFKVTGQVTLGESVAGMQALLHRHGGQPPSISWTIN